MRIRVGFGYGGSARPAKDHGDQGEPADQVFATVVDDLERLGFDSLWVGEHTHIPASRETPFPGGGDLPKPYYHMNDPFVTLGMAAAVTKSFLI